MADYDIITVGGGLGGAALAKAMAERGASVLALERETQFKDRVRGEGMTPWGVAVARELGILGMLLSSCAHELPWWDIAMNGMQVAHRPLAETNPHGTPAISFYHPAMQEALLGAAAAAGADVRRGVRARDVKPGSPATVTVDENGGTKEFSARLVVGADGRGSLVRKWSKFDERQDPESLRIAGVLFEDMHGAGTDAVNLMFNIDSGREAITFPQGGGKVRTYVITRHDEGIRLQGEKDVGQFIEIATSCGVPKEFFVGAKPAGPLATFEGAACWVEHPYRDGVALIGDAASTSDPSWGQGLSLTLHAARLLRDALVENDDWDAAGKAYAAAQNASFMQMHKVESVFEQLLMGQGPEAEAKRAQALPIMAQDPTALPDHMFSGPDLPIEGEIARIYAS